MTRRTKQAVARNPRSAWRVDHRLIGMFDILGFSDLMGRFGLEPLTQRIRRLIDLLDSLFRWEARAATFSDTILVYSGSRHMRPPEYDSPISRIVPEIHADAFLRYCALLMAEAIFLELPLRGGIACGPCVIVPSRGIFLGQPIIDAYLLEESQDWIGVALHDSCAPFIDLGGGPWTLPVRYGIPMKGDNKVDGVTLEWPRMTQRPVALREKLEELAHSYVGTPYERRWQRTWEYFETRFGLLAPHPREGDPGYGRVTHGEYPKQTRER